MFPAISICDNVTAIKALSIYSIVLGKGVNVM